MTLGPNKGRKHLPNLRRGGTTSGLFVGQIVMDQEKPLNGAMGETQQWKKMTERGNGVCPFLGLHLAIKTTKLPRSP